MPYGKATASLQPALFDGRGIQNPGHVRAERRRERWNAHGRNWRKREHGWTGTLAESAEDARGAARDHLGCSRGRFEEGGAGLATRTTRPSGTAGTSSPSNHLHARSRNRRGLERLVGAPAGAALPEACGLRGGLEEPQPRLELGPSEFETRGAGPTRLVPAALAAVIANHHETAALGSSKMVSNAENRNRRRCAPLPRRPWVRHRRDKGKTGTSSLVAGRWSEGEPARS